MKKDAQAVCAINANATSSLSRVAVRNFTAVCSM